MKKIWLAGGCFWGVEAYFMQLKGVLTTKVGYGQGNTADPTYKQVCSGKTGYTEVCEITYNEESLSLEKVLEHFFRIINPVTINRQGPDEGPQYRSGVYYSEAGDKEAIIDFIKEKQAFYKEPIVVEVESVRNFHLAEDYHQEYLEKNPSGYCHVNLMLARPEEKK